VILINLLPHREAARKLRRDIFKISMAASVVVGLLIAGAIYLWFQSRISDQQAQNRMLQGEIKRLEGQIKDIATLEVEIAGLRARQQAVEDLQSDRNLPVHLMTELAKQLPDGVYVASMKQDNQNVTLLGVAQSNERVSELLRNLSKNTPWFTRPELVEIVSGSVTLSPRDIKRVFNFTMRVQIQRPSDVEKAAAASAAPVATAAAPAAPAPAAAASAPAKK
jgi:type IV pilus assembly protein PilN